MCMPLCVCVCVCMYHTCMTEKKEIYFKNLAHAIMKTDKPEICIEQIGRLEIQRRGHGEVQV